EMRDGFGELLPLAYCSSCDSYYPASVGECRWCGTKPEPAPDHSHIWKRVGTGAVAVLAVLAFLMRDSRPKHAAAPRVAKRPSVDSSYTALDTVAPVLTTVPVDTIVAATPVVPVAPRVTPASTRNVERVSAPPSEAPASSIASATKSRASARWVN